MTTYQPIIIILLVFTILSFFYYNISRLWNKIVFLFWVFMYTRKSKFFYYIAIEYDYEKKEVKNLNEVSNSGLCSHKMLVVLARSRQEKPLDDGEVQALIEETKQLKTLMTAQQKQHIIKELTKHLSE